MNDLYSYHLILTILLFSKLLPCQNLAFENYVELQGLTGYYFNCVVEDRNGFIWTSTKNHGIYRWDGNEYKHYRPQNESSSFGIIHCVNVDDDGHLWIASDQGVFNYDFKKDAILLDTIITHQAELNCIDIWDIYFYEDLILLGTDCGVEILDSNKRIIDHIEIPEFFEGQGRKEERILSLHFDHDEPDLLWIGTKYGLKSFDFKLRKLSTYPGPPKWHDAYATNQQYAIYDIVQSKDNNLWLAACWSGGILNYEIENASWNQYLYPGSVKEDPYYGNSLHSLSSLNDSSFFYSNNRGGGYFDLLRNKMRPLNLPDYEYHTNHDSEHTIDRNGFVWIVGIEGIFKSLSPLKTMADKTLPVPFVKRVTINDRRWNYPQGKTVKSTIDSNDLQIELSVANRMESEFVSIEYLINDDVNWKTINVHQPLTLNNLSKGKHKIRYRLIADNLQVTGEGLPIEIIITVPLLKSVWFRALCLLGIFMGIWFFYNWRIAAVRKEEQRKLAFEKQLAEVEMSALRAQMNPHFLFNTMTSINHYILKNDVDNASHYLTKFSRLVRQVLNNSKSKTVTLENEISVLRLYIELERLRFDHQFTFNIKIKPKAIAEEIHIPPMLIQPYVENAIWHGLLPIEDRIGDLNISIERLDDYLKVIIADNGIGRAASQAIKTSYQKSKKSYGLQITKNRIKTINQIYRREAKVEIVDILNDKMVSGTKVLLWIPIILDAGK